MPDEAEPFACLAHPCALKVAAHARRDEIVLVFSGEADVAAAPLLTHALTQASVHAPERVAVDLSGLEFIDTHCLDIILGTQDKLRARGADLVLRSPQPSVLRMLQLLERQDLIELS